MSGWQCKRLVRVLAFHATLERQLSAHKRKPRPWDAAFFGSAIAFIYLPG